MKNSKKGRSAVARFALAFTPPSMRESLALDSDFMDKNDLNSDAVVTLRDFDVSVSWPLMKSRIREFFSNDMAVEVEDIEGRTWELINIRKEGEAPSLEMRLSEKHLPLPDYSALALEQDIRLIGFERVSSEVNLPKEAKDKWRDIIVERPLSDDELEEYHRDIRATPVFTRQLIRKELEAGEISISTLVPPSELYFERLIGKYDGSAHIQDYASSVGESLFQQLSEWSPEEGFLLSLLLSSHLETSKYVVVDNISSDQLSNIYRFLIEQGDKISQLGAIEVGFRVLPAFPEIESGIIQLIEHICGDDAKDETSSFYNLSAMFMMVYGEMSRIRLLSNKPPFYRRMAALAQATLIQRQLINVKIDIEKFSAWAIESRGEQYYFQTLSDMRLEPRWSPDLAASYQLKAEFIGRIMLMAEKFKSNFENGSLHDLIFGDKSFSSKAQVDVLSPHLPGPLEGTENFPLHTPGDLLESIREQLSSDELTPESFIAVVNSAMLYGVNEDHASLVIEALRAGKHHVENVTNQRQLITILTGLASVAAVARSPSLAEELKLLTYKYTRDAEYKISSGEALRICLGAAASHKELQDWCNFVGEWVTWLAFSDLKGEENLRLRSHLRSLLHAVPELWGTCARADAALAAFNYL